MVRVIEKDGQKLYEYIIKCGKCGRTDPYTTPDATIISPLQTLRMELEAEGLQKTAIAGKINPSSDQMGAPQPSPNPLDADWEARNVAGLI